MSRRTRKPKKVAPRARHKAKTKITVKHCKPGSGCEPPTEGFEALRKTIKASNPYQRVDLFADIGNTPDHGKAFWSWLVSQYPGSNAIGRDIGIGQGTLKKHLERAGVIDPATGASTRTGWNSPMRQTFRPFFERTESLCERYGKDRLPADRSWMLVACPHIPTISELWTDRMLAVAEVEKCTALAIVGDLFNADALSKFAEKEGGHALRFQKELDACEEFLGNLADLFDFVVIMGGNHADRPIFALKSQIDAPWLFEKFFAGVKWYDGEEMWLGDMCLAHTRGRKVLSSASEEHSMVEECDYIIGGPHRFFFGFSRSVSRHRIVYLGGLFDREKMRYYNKQAKYIHWANGFAVWKRPDILLPFGEENGRGFVDWSRYGTK